MRAGREIRITFALGEDKEGARAVVLHNVGHHDPTLRPLSGQTFLLTGSL